MLSYSRALPKYLPDFYEYLLTYPTGKPAEVEDTFYWAKVKFGLKPTLRVVHVLTMHGKTPAEPSYTIAEKQLYSSHYFETALDLTFCVPELQTRSSPGFIRSWQWAPSRRASRDSREESFERSQWTGQPPLSKNRSPRS